MLAGDDRFLHRVHTAHCRAVPPLDRVVTRTDALQPGNPLRRLAVRRPLHVAAVRPGRGEDPLELEARDHVRVAAVAVFGTQRSRRDLRAGGDHDRTDLDRELLVLLRVVDCAGLARLLARAALVLGVLQAMLAVNHGRIRHRLCVETVDGAPVRKPTLKLVRQILDRALGHAVAAAGALRQVDRACVVLEPDLEGAGLTLDAEHLG